MIKHGLRRFIIDFHPSLHVWIVIKQENRLQLLHLHALRFHFVFMYSEKFVGCFLFSHENVEVESIED